MTCLLYGLVRPCRVANVWLVPWIREPITIEKNKFEKYLFGGNNESGLNKGKLIEKRLGYNIDNYKEFEKEILKRLKKNQV